MNWIEGCWKEAWSILEIENFSLFIYVSMAGFECFEIKLLIQLSQIPP